MTFEEALKEIEILKLQNKKMGEAFDSLDKKYDLLKLELELAQACHKEKCAEFNKLCFDYAKLQVKNEKFEQNMKNVLEIEKKNAVKEFAEKVKEEVVCNLSCKGTAINNTEEIKACATMARQLLYLINSLLNEDYGFDKPLCASDQFKVEPELIKKYKIDELFKRFIRNDEE